jgi:D-serine deaminase-like pyridoxal phosphate-dependent protein
MNRRNFLTAGVSATLAGAAAASAPAGTTAGEEFRGRTKADLPTPSLLVDLDRFERNLRTMADHCQKAGCGYRPHAKTHKCPEIARRQIAAGAPGVCVATVAEAEAMVAAGIRGVLLTSPIVDRHKIARMVRLAQKGDVLLAVGHPRECEMLSDAAQAANVTLAALVDADVGDRRTGIQPGEPALALGGLIGRSPNLRLRGLQAYSGRASHTVGFEQREKVSREAMQRAVDTRELFTKNRLEPAFSQAGAPARTTSTVPYAASRNCRWARMCSWTSTIAALADAIMPMSMTTFNQA